MNTTESKEIYVIVLKRSYVELKFYFEDWLDATAFLGDAVIHCDDDITVEVRREIVKDGEDGEADV